MEEVFADAFFDLHEHPNDATSRNAYIDLVDLYLRVLRETTNWLCEDRRRGAPVGRLIALTAREADDLTIITFNHDLVIENEIERRANLRGRWCLDLSYGTLSAALVGTSPMGPVPEFTLHSAEQCDHTRPIRLLKLHGSLNWVVRLSSDRPTGNFLRGQTGGRRNVYLLTRRRIEGRETIVRTGRGRSRWETWPVVVPPVYAKQALRAAVQATWEDARDALEQAERLVFFGYSLPGLDIEAEKLFERSMTANASIERIEVINPAPTSAARFAGLVRNLPMRWFPSLEEFIAQERNT
jgi:hypothetical protein